MAWSVGQDVLRSIRDFSFTVKLLEVIFYSHHLTVVSLGKLHSLYVCFLYTEIVIAPLTLS